MSNEEEYSNTDSNKNRKIEVKQATRSFFILSITLSFLAVLFFSYHIAKPREKLVPVSPVPRPSTERNIENSPPQPPPTNTFDIYSRPH